MIRVIVFKETLGKQNTRCTIEKTRKKVCRKKHGDVVGGVQTELPKRVSHDINRGLPKQ
jgi:hypothetical protein